MKDIPTYEIELTEDHYDFLFRAGASPQFLEVIRKTDDELSDVIDRNSARVEIQKYVKWGDLDGNPETFSHMGGDFFTQLWNGDLYQAFAHADPNNRKILLLTFGDRRINQDRPNTAYPTAGQIEGRV